jgi:hypothetical protein
MGLKRFYMRDRRLSVAYDNSVHFETGYQKDIKPADVVCFFNDLDEHSLFFVIESFII